MSTKPSGDKEGGEFVSTQVCNATKEELKEAGLRLADDCPLCAERGVTLEVGNHLSDQPTGNKNNGVDALNLFVPVYLSPSRCCFLKSLSFIFTEFSSFKEQVEKLNEKIDQQGEKLEKLIATRLHAGLQG